MIMSLISLLPYAQYAQHKGFAVIPLMPDSLTPAINDWLSYTFVRPDERTLRQWFDVGGNNLGFITGEASGIVVLASTKACCDSVMRNGRRLPPTLQMTRSGIVYAYFRLPSGSPYVPTAAIGRGRVLHGEGSFCGLPPDSRRINGLNWWGDENEIAEMPLWLIDLAKDKETFTFTS